MEVVAQQKYTAIHTSQNKIVYLSYTLPSRRFSSAAEITSLPFLLFALLLLLLVVMVPPGLVYTKSHAC